MRHADEALNDQRLPEIIQEELSKHCKEEQDSRTPVNTGRSRSPDTVAQTYARADNRILSMFESDTEAIRKGKASKPAEFGEVVKIQGVSTASRRQGSP
jgi:IS5 family transposase